jgi:uncharacterized integral membrane protein
MEPRPPPNTHRRNQAILAALVIAFLFAILTLIFAVGARGM